MIQKLIQDLSTFIANSWTILNNKSLENCFPAQLNFTRFRCMNGQITKVVWFLELVFRKFRISVWYHGRSFTCNE